MPHIWTGLLQRSGPPTEWPESPRIVATIQDDEKGGEEDDGEDDTLCAADGKGDEDEAADDDAAGPNPIVMGVLLGEKRSPAQRNARHCHAPVSLAGDLLTRARFAVSVCTGVPTLFSLIAVILVLTATKPDTSGATCEGMVVASFLNM